MALSPSLGRGTDQLVPAAVPSSRRLDLRRRFFCAALDGAYLLEDRAATRSFASPGPGRAPAPRGNQEGPRQPTRLATRARRQLGVRACTVEATSAGTWPPSRAAKTETLSLSRRHGEWGIHWPQKSESVARSAGIPW
jgi:hypothetical protein